MSVLPTYPGVYIEELPSQVRTITGVATSITAFLGRARRGPVNKAVTITSFSDFERNFGGLWANSTMSYAVQDFYRNGGNRAVIVRIARDATKATIILPAGSASLTLEAASEGSWGDVLYASVNYRTKDATNTNLFNLTITERRDGGSIERFLNVSVDVNDPRYLPRVLEQGSMLVRVQGAMSAGRPDETLVASTESPPSSPIKMVDVPKGVDTKGSDGDDVTAAEYQGTALAKSGLFALQDAEFNILCIPPPTRDGDTDNTVYQNGLQLCVEKRAILLVDAPASWAALPAFDFSRITTGLDDLALSGNNAVNAALYFPRVRQLDPQRDNQIDTFVPCGMIAGIMARTDSTRGVWKSPAGTEASLNGVQGLQFNMTDDENGQLNVLGVNCLRSFPVTGRVVWGARTLKGADALADQYKYLAVRRTALFIEESLYRATKWVVFEPNDEPLWAQIRLNVGAFMHNLFRQGAFQGTTPSQAYLVKCDKETTTQNDINLGIVNILVGFAPLKPAEFVIIKIQQLPGEIES